MPNPSTCDFECDKTLIIVHTKNVDEIINRSETESTNSFDQKIT